MFSKKDKHKNCTEWKTIIVFFWPQYKAGSKFRKSRSSIIILVWVWEFLWNMLSLIWTFCFQANCLKPTNWKHWKKYFKINGRLKLKAELPSDDVRWIVRVDYKNRMKCWLYLVMNRYGNILIKLKKWVKFDFMKYSFCFKVQFLIIIN